MRWRSRGLIATLAIVPMMVGFDAPVASYSYGAGSRIWIEGTSSVRSYTCEAGRIDGGVRGTTATSIEQLQSAVQSADLAVPVATLDCGNGTMNGHMFRTLNVDDEPFIRYTHQRHVVTTRANGEATVRMTGNLTIAGTTKPVTLEGRAVQQDGGFRLIGAHELKMTDFGVRPPTLMLGTLKVHDGVTVNFDLYLRP